MPDTDNGAEAAPKVEEPGSPRVRPIWGIGYIKRKLHERRAEYEAQTPEQKAAWRTANATVWIAVFTIVLATVGGITLYEVMAGGTDTHDLAIAAEKQATATNALATAAQDSANIARQQLEASSRPWVTAAVSSVGPLRFTPSGAQLQFEVMLFNVGQSPAVNLDIRGDVVAFAQRLNVMDREKRFIESYRLQPRVIVATLFPKQPPQKQPLPGMVVREEDDSDAFSGPYTFLSIVGCVCYRLDSPTDRHTCFAYNVAQITDSGEEQMALPGNLRKDVPANRLRVYQNLTSGVPAN